MKYRITKETLNNGKVTFYVEYLDRWSGIWRRQFGDSDEYVCKTHNYYRAKAKLAELVGNQVKSTEVIE